MKEKELLYIEETAQELSQQTVLLRRQLHQIPETAWKEFRTTSFLQKELEKLGFRVTIGSAVSDAGTGLIAEIGSDDSLIIGLRFDIDALAVAESEADSHIPASRDFRSAHAGNMHACGHDGHMAIGLTTAKILSQHRSRLHGTVRLLFQPAEEGCMGAKELIKKGWLQDVDYFLAGHIVDRSYGQTVYGPADCVTAVSGSLATTKLNAVFKGHSCHGACPENGASAITALCSSVLALNGIPRNSGGSTMINIGRISGGEGRNIVAAEASMELEVRGETTALNQYMEDKALAIIDAAAKMHGCSSEVTILGKAPSLVSSEDFHRQINTLLKGLSSVRISTHGERFKASEDAALMLEEVKRQGGQAVFMLFPTETTAPLHSCNFDFNEEILTKAAIVFSSIVLDILN